MDILWSILKIVLVLPYLIQFKEVQLSFIQFIFKLIIHFTYIEIRQTKKIWPEKVINEYNYFFFCRTLW